MDQSNKATANPWDGIEGLAQQAVKNVTTAVKKVVPWEGVDTTPKQAPTPAVAPQKMDMNVSAVPLKTEVQMKAAMQGIGPDTSDPRNNIAEIDAELKKAKDPEVIKILQAERRKNERRLTTITKREAGPATGTPEWYTARDEAAQVKYQKDTTKLLKIASEVPEYKALHEFLTNMRGLPDIRVGGLRDSNGMFEQPVYKTGTELSDRGRITLRSDNKNPTSTLVHEMTHAADSQIGKLAGIIRKKENASPEEEQFLDNYQKLYKGDKADGFKSWVSKLSYTINKEWDKNNADYRSTDDEMRAFAVGNSSDPSRVDVHYPSKHLDASVATAFMQLLEQANKLAIKNTPKGR